MVGLSAAVELFIGPAEAVARAWVHSNGRRPHALLR